MDVSSLLAFAAILAVAAGTPGPSVGALIARVVSKGAKGVFPFLLGLWMGDAIWLSAAVWGLAALAHSFYTLFLVIKYIGIAYLLYLAWKMWQAPLTVSEEQSLPQDGEALKLFLSALAVTLGNPKIMVFYMAILPTVLDLSKIGLIGWMELIAVVFIVLAMVDSAWVLLAAQARRLLRSPRAMKIANRTSAGMMAGAAVAIATR